jgi:hypothetical protein
LEPFIRLGVYPLRDLFGTFFAPVLALFGAAAFNFFPPFFAAPFAMDFALFEAFKVPESFELFEATEPFKGFKPFRAFEVFSPFPGSESFFSRARSRASALSALFL